MTAFGDQSVFLWCVAFACEVRASLSSVSYTGRAHTVTDIDADIVRERTDVYTHGKKYKIRKKKTLEAWTETSEISEAERFPFKEKECHPVLGVYHPEN